MLFAKMSVVEDVRTAERRDLAESTTIRLGAVPRPVGVFNLSATGCLIRSSEPLSTGLEIRIGLPGVGAFTAEVVRSDGLDAGCRFSEPLTAQQLAAAFQNDVVVDGNWVPEPAGAWAEPAVDQLSGRAKLACILCLSGALWGLIATGLSFTFAG